MITCFYPYIQLKWDSTIKKFSFFERWPIQPRQLALEVAPYPSHDMVGHDKMSCSVVSILFLKIKWIAQHHSLWLVALSDLKVECRKAPPPN